MEETTSSKFNMWLEILKHYGFPILLVCYLMFVERPEQLKRYDQLTDKLIETNREYNISVREELLENKLLLIQHSNAMESFRLSAKARQVIGTPEKRWSFFILSNFLCLYLHHGLRL